MAAITTASAVADWLVWFAAEHGETITNLRLQKLLYYAQAWHLANAGVPLFDEHFEAWIHGPVIPAIYGKYKQFGGNPIPAPGVGVGEEHVLPEPPLPSQVKQHLLEVMEAYGPLRTWQLEKLTHQEAPWLEARAGIPLDDHCQSRISRETMTRFYRELARASGEDCKSQH